MHFMVYFTETIEETVERHEELQPPSFVKPLTPLQAVTGSEVKMTCKVIGQPMPELSWFQNKVCIDQSEEIVITYDTTTGDASLLIPEVYPEDQGLYSCVATNPAGKATTTANIIVSKETVTMEMTTSESVETSAVESEFVIKASEEQMAVEESIEPKEKPKTEEPIPEGWEKVDQPKEEVLEKMPIEPIDIGPTEPQGEVVEEKEITPERKEKGEIVVKFPEEKPTAEQISEVTQVETFVTERESISETSRTVIQEFEVGEDVAITDSTAVEVVIQTQPEAPETKETGTEPVPKMTSEIGVDAVEMKPETTEMGTVTETTEMEVQPEPQPEAVEVKEELVVQVPPSVTEQKTGEMVEATFELPTEAPEEMEVTPTQPEEVVQEVTVETAEIKTETPQEFVEEMIVQIPPKEEGPAQVPEEETVTESVEEVTVQTTEEVTSETVTFETEVEGEIQPMETVETVIQIGKEEQAPQEESAPMEEVSGTFVIDALQSQEEIETETIEAPESQEIELQLAPVTEIGEQTVTETITLTTEEEEVTAEEQQIEETATIESEFTITMEGSTESLEAAPEEAPEFVEMLQPQRVKDGERVTMTCRVIGTPFPEITWQHNEEIITESSDFEVITETETGICKLVIVEVFPEDGGTIICKAVNPFGEAVTTATLVVEGVYKRDLITNHGICLGSFVYLHV